VEAPAVVNNQTMADNSLPLLIGQSISSSWFSGTIDEVALYNVALTSSQISNHYEAGSATAPDPVIAAAGDIACGTGDAGEAQPGVACEQQSTSNLLSGGGLTAVLALGDDQYEQGTLSDFMNYFDPTWGRFKSIMRSVPGNHEYTDPAGGAAGYFDYFDGVGNETGPEGSRALGYYSFDIGAWHFIAVNSNCSTSTGGWKPGGCAAGSTQEEWVRSDLAAHKSSCTLAFWHHPVYSSSSQPDGASPFMSAIWADLANAHADIVLNGHAHDYERFALQNATGGLDATAGLREFVVGTGGRNLYPFATVKPNSEARNSTTFGVLRLTLHPHAYDWKFQATPGGTFTDAGSQQCHGR
ncbi:MAG TPA: metallophosphoesterase, partial [Solirubrobacteraceae bacterium]